MKRTTLVLSLGLLLAACSNAMVGEPPLVTRSSESARVLPGCKTVKSNAPAVEFTTQYYMTTWGSAVAEGAAMGVREGLQEGGGVGLIALARLRRIQSVNGNQLLWRSANQSPFCMVIAQPESRVAPALRRTMRDLGKFGYRARDLGPLTTTSFVNREHRAAKWVDRFSGYTYPLPNNRTAVVVRRDVLISRQGSPYIQANSVGALEGWILTRTRDRL